MRLTTELKNIIKRAFEEKVRALEDEYYNKKKAEYDQIIKELEDSPEYQAFSAAAKKLDEKLETYRFPNNEWQSHVHGNPGKVFCEVKDILRANISKYPYQNDEFCNKIIVLNNERDSLLVKLTYEKDLEKISAILAEYGITL